MSRLWALRHPWQAGADAAHPRQPRGSGALGWGRRAGLTPPPALHRGKLAGPEALHALCMMSAFSDVVVEGLIVRHERDGALRQRAKWVRPDFVRKPDDAWDLRAVNAVVGAGG